MTTEAPTEPWVHTAAGPLERQTWERLTTQQRGERLARWLEVALGDEEGRVLLTTEGFPAVDTETLVEAVIAARTQRLARAFHPLLGDLLARAGGGRLTP